MLFDFSCRTLNTMALGNLLKHVCAVLALSTPLLGWLLFLIDPVLAVFALYAGILFSGIYSIFPASKVVVYALGIFASIVVAIFASHYSVKEGLSPLNPDAMRNALSIVIPPFLITAPLLLISTLKKLRTRYIVIEPPGGGEGLPHGASNPESPGHQQRQ